jgi:hypothetical protein
MQYCDRISNIMHFELLSLHSLSDVRHSIIVEAVIPPSKIDTLCAESVTLLNECTMKEELTVEWLLKRYCSVLVWGSSKGWSGDKIGDLLADYTDKGGSVVCAVFSNCPTCPNGIKYNYINNLFRNDSWTMEQRKLRSNSNWKSR